MIFSRLTTPRFRRPLTLGRKFLFSLAASILFFLALEVGGRLVHGWNRHWLDCHRWHPVLGWSLRENWAGWWCWTGGYSRINAQGIRDNRPVGPKAPTEQRLLMLGDSITFGAGVRTEQACPAQLERALKQAGRPWRVLNGGVTSYDPAQEADWLELFGWQLQPDFLAVCFCRNDVGPSDRSQDRGSEATGTLSRWLTEHSILAYNYQRALWYLQARLGLASPTQVPAQADAQPREQLLVGWPFVEQSYRCIAQRARERNIPVLLVVYPTLDQLEGRTTDDLSERLQKLCLQLGWHVIDLETVFAAEPASLFLKGDTLHPNAAGYQRAAEFLARSLTEQHWLP